jgi:hypothetical protein
MGGDKMNPLLQNQDKSELEKYLLEKYGNLPSDYAMSMPEPELLGGDLTPGSSAQPLMTPQLAMARIPTMEDVAPGAVSPTVPVQPPLIEPIEKPAPKLVKPGVADVMPKSDSSMIDYMRKQEEEMSGFDERLKKARESGPNIGQVIGMGLAGLGEAISGKPYLQTTMRQAQDSLEQRVKNIEAEKATFEEKDTRNPDSFISQKYRELAAKYMNKSPNELAGMSAYQIARVLPTIKSMFEADLAAEEKAANRAYKESMVAIRERESGMKQTEEQKLSARSTAKKKQTYPKEKALLKGTEAKYDQMIREAEELMKHSGLGAATGITKWTTIVPGSPAADAQAKINTLKSKTGFSVLQDMRASSPTGGALGQVSDRENAMLQENIASLDQNQSTAQFRQNLQNIIDFAKGSKERLRSNYNEFYSDVDPDLKPAQENPVSGISDADRQAALDWIQQNPTDSRVPAIKAKLGVQ